MWLQEPVAADQTQDVFDHDRGKSDQNGQVVVMAAGAARETPVVLVTAAENLVLHAVADELVVGVVVAAVAVVVAQEADEIVPVAATAVRGDSYDGV